MVSSESRKERRLQLGAYRKSTAIRWIGCWVVRILFAAGKRMKGLKSPSLNKKTRRGQRGHGKSERDLSRSSTLPKTPARTEKPQSSRKFNHSARKHWWAVKAANRLSAREPVKQLIKEMPWDFGHMSSSQAKRFADALRIGSPRWVKFRDSWHVYSYRCRWIGARPEGRDPLHFLALRSPRAGGADLEELFSFLPRQAPPEPPRITRFCRRCGDRYFGVPSDHWHCRFGDYVGPEGGHSEELCRQIRMLESTLELGMSSKKRRRG